MNLCSFGTKSIQTMKIFNLKKNQIIKTPIAEVLWEPTTNFDRLLTWMWGSPGYAKIQVELGIPISMDPVNLVLDNVDTYNKVDNMTPLLSDSY